MTNILYPNSASVPDAPSILNLSEYVEPVADTTPCQAVFDRFLAEKKTLALAVVDASQRPVALIERHAFVEFFGQPFTKEIHGKKPVIEMTAPTVNHRAIVVDASAAVDDVAQIVIDAGMEHMVSGFIVSDGGRYAGLANGHSLLDEITQRRQAELYALAHYDQLTGLPNRRLFLDRVEHVIRESKRSTLKAAVLFVDVDKFKQINDTLGHATGDHLLREVAVRLADGARESDTVARLGGDEFGIVMEWLGSSADCQHIASRILESMKQPFSVMGHLLYVTVSIGIALYPNDDETTAGLLMKADAAMYEAKNSGRNAFRYFHPDFARASLDSMSLEMELRTAIEADQLVLHYQPQINIGSGNIVGVEALVRWMHPTRGLLSPAHFVPIAEQSQLIVDMGYWVLRAACAQHLKWRAEGLPPLTISINVSTLQFDQVDFAQRVEAIFREAAVDPRCFEFELTESIMMHNGVRALETLRKLRAIGISLALDDFGTGFSSLSYLRQFPINRLKIDQSFVREIDKSASSESIVKAVTALGKSLAMDVIAEGVETSEEFGVVQACECDGAQGYLFFKPLAAADLAHAIRMQRGGRIQQTAHA